MIGLLPIGRVIAYAAVGYATLVVLLGLALSQYFGPQSNWQILRLALAGATPIQLGLMAWIWFGWRTLWRWVPSLNRLLFPDLGGQWAMEIHWNRSGAQGVVNATATIRQDFVRISMEVVSKGSESQTLSAHPKRDSQSGRPELHYIYSVTPHAMSGPIDPPYIGAAILKFSEPSGDLRGNYWTSAMTSGHFHLIREP